MVHLRPLHELKGLPEAACPAAVVAGIADAIPTGPVRLDRGAGGSGDPPGLGVVVEMGHPLRCSPCRTCLRSYIGDGHECHGCNHSLHSPGWGLDAVGLVPHPGNRAPLAGMMTLRFECRYVHRLDCRDPAAAHRGAPCGGGGHHRLLRHAAEAEALTTAATGEATEAGTVPGAAAGGRIARKTRSSTGPVRIWPWPRQSRQVR
jgi:hypothetical protein